MVPIAMSGYSPADIRLRLQPDAFHVPVTEVN
jgi:hypothetical protein